MLIILKPRRRYPVLQAGSKTLNCFKNNGHLSQVYLLVVKFTHTQQTFPWQLKLLSPANQHQKSLASTTVNKAHLP